MNEAISKFLEKRLGRVHAKLRLGIEAEHEAQVFGQGINYFHIENLRSSHFVIPSSIEVGWTISDAAAEMRRRSRSNVITSDRLKIPKAFDGLRHSSA